jgi:hypothetical protein
MHIKNIVTLSIVASFVTITASAQQTVTVNKNGVAFNLRIPVESKIVKGAPLSADIETESIQTLPDGNRIVQRSTSRVYRDGEGRVRREEDRGSASPAISITDPVAGVSFMLDAENHRALQTSNATGFGFIELQSLQLHLEQMRTAAEDHRKATEVASVATDKFARAREAGRGGEQVRVEQLPERTIEGVRAVGVRRTTTVAAGAIGNDLPIEIVSEEWTSPELSMLLLTERRDPRVGTSTYRVMNIIRAEPDRSLFEVPSDYTLNQTGPAGKPIVGGGGRGSAPLPQSPQP